MFGGLTMLRLSDDLQVGKAGEYLVCFDLIMKGFVAYPSEQGLPYDLVLDTGNKMLKIQVKTTREPRIIPQREKEYKTYFYHVKRNGKGGKNHYADDEVDVFALVALDTRQVGYILNGDMPTSLSLRVDSMRGTYGDEQGLKHYNDIMKLKGKMSQQEIADTLGISKTIVNKMCCKTYKPYISNARYFSDIIRDADWFEQI